MSCVCTSLHDQLRLICIISFILKEQISAFLEIISKVCYWSSKLQLKIVEQRQSISFIMLDKKFKVLVRLNLFLCRSFLFRLLLKVPFHR